MYSMYELNAKNIILAMARDYNRFSELEALNYEKAKTGRFDLLMAARLDGATDTIRRDLTNLANDIGAKLIWEHKEHEFGYDDWKRTLEYETVSVSFD